MKTSAKAIETAPANDQAAKPRVSRTRHRQPDRSNQRRRTSSRSPPSWRSAPSWPSPCCTGSSRASIEPPSSGLDEEWVGVQNYIDMFTDPDFWNSVYRTAIFVTGNLVIGLTPRPLLCLRAVSDGRPIALHAGRTLAPYLISNVAAAVMFRLIFNSDLGLINSFLGLFGIDGPAWLSSTTWAMAVVDLHPGLDRSSIDDPAAARRPHDDRSFVSRRRTG